MTDFKRLTEEEIHSVHTPLYIYREAVELAYVRIDELELDNIALKKRIELLKSYMNHDALDSFREGEGKKP